MKDFSQELKRFVNMILTGQNFALGRFADGEGCIVLNMDEEKGGWLDRPRITASWNHIPGDAVHERFRTRLIAALSYAVPGYYIGIPCRSGHAPQYAHFFEELKKFTRVPEDQLTFARVFHSYNYPAFKSEFLPSVFPRQVFLVCNERADTSAIPGVVHRWNVAAANASLESLPVIEQIKTYIREKDVRDGVFLISTGPSAAVFAHELWALNRHNSYLDIGSALDPVYFRNSPCRGITRIYLRKFAEGRTDIKPFVWG